MWILNWLPDWIFYGILMLGLLAIIGGWIIKNIPGIKQYSLFLQLGGVLLTLLGTWYSGGIAKDAEWKAKIAELQQKVAEAEVKSAAVNTQIVTKYVNKKQIIKEKGDDVIQYVDREVVKYDSACKIPTAVITAHNAFAVNKSTEEILTPVSDVKTDDHNKLAAGPDSTTTKKTWLERTRKQ
jgi:hypothetical protein